MGAAQAVPWTMIPLLLDKLGYSKSDIGAVQSSDAWGKVLMAIPAALILSRRPTRGVLVSSALLAALAYCLLPWMPSLKWIMALNLVAGSAWSVHYVAIAPFLFRNAQVQQQARVFGLSEAVHTAAAVAGAFLGGRLAVVLTQTAGDEANALAWVVTSGGVMALCAAWPYLRIQEAPRSFEHTSASPRSALLPVLRAHRGLLLRFALPTWMIGVGASMSIPFLGLYFHERFDRSAGDYANYQALASVLMTAGYLLTPMLISRLGFVRCIVGLELASLPFFLVLAFTTSLPLAVAAFLLRGCLMNAATPVIKNLSMRAAPEGVREAQTAVTSLANSLGWVMGPQVGGWILDSGENRYSSLMVATIAIYVLAALVTWRLLSGLENRSREYRQRDREEDHDAGDIREGCDQRG
jgi:predicted MFS family arabinose efflux permease